MFTFSSLPAVPPPHQGRRSPPGCRPAFSLLRQRVSAGTRAGARARLVPAAAYLTQGTSAPGGTGCTANPAAILQD